MEKVSSLERFFLTMSPSRRVTDLFPISRSLARTIFATVDFPEPDKPVKKSVTPCSDFEGGVRVVEVEQVPFRAGVPKSMVVEGSVITFHPQGCGVWGCENRLLANPVDLADGSRIKVVTILSEKTCADGSSFLEALVDLAD